MVFTKGDEQMIKNLKRKQLQAIQMFDKLVEHMNKSLTVNNLVKFEKNMEVASWL
jgi:hypothetical protein